MAEIVVYSSAWCPYCFRAKQLLDKNGVRYEEINIGVGVNRIQKEIPQFAPR